MVGEFVASVFERMVSDNTDLQGKGNESPDAGPVSNTQTDMGDNPDNYKLNKDGSVKIEETSDKSNTYFAESGEKLLTIGENLTLSKYTNTSPLAIYDFIHIAAILKPVQYEKMLARAIQEGWSAHAQVEEMKRWGGIYRAQLRKDAGTSFAPSTPLKNLLIPQSVMEGKPTTPVGIFFPKADAAYGAARPGRDLQYDMIRSPGAIWNAFKNYMNQTINSWNNTLNNYLMNNR